MKGRFFTFGVGMGLAAAALWLAPTIALAQTQANPVQADKSPKGPVATPKSPDGHPDLTGYWGNPYARFFLAIQGKKSLAGLGTQPPTAPKAFTVDPKDPDRNKTRAHAFVDGDIRREAAIAKDPNLMPPYKPELMAKVKDLDFNSNHLDPSFFCKPDGVPRLGPPRQIVQSKGLVVFLYQHEGFNDVRVIPTDGRPHREDADASYNGDSVGHWEGNTLVVDVTNLTEDSWLGISGWYHSAKMHVVERLSRDGNTLRYQATVDDPEVFSRPWVENPRLIELYTNPTYAIITEEPPCVETDIDHIVNHEHL